MTRTLRIKVNVTDLISKMETTRAQRWDAYEKAMSTYPEKVAAWQQKVTDSLQRIAANGVSVDEVKVDTQYVGPSRNTRRAGLFVAGRFPSAPEQPIKPNTSQLDKDIALLRVSADDVITLSTDDRLASYL